MASALQRLAYLEMASGLFFIKPQMLRNVTHSPLLDDLLYKAHGYLHLLQKINTRIKHTRKPFAQCESICNHCGIGNFVKNQASS